MGNCAVRILRFSTFHISISYLVKSYAPDFARPKIDVDVKRRGNPFSLPIRP